jgi:DNA-binding NarL/FixJ family response regulator
MKRTRVFIVDDHPIFRRGLREVINADASIEVIGEAGDGSTAFEQIKSSRPDIAILDIHLPGMSGLELCQSLQRLRPPVAVIMLTLHDQETTFNAALDSGAQSYLLKENAVQEVLSALQAVISGNIYFSPAVAHFMLTRRQRASALREQRTGLKALTPTERLVLRLVGENKTNRQIGEDLCISHRTVETHRSHICEKLDLHGNRALLQFALEHRSKL